MFLLDSIIQIPTLTNIDSFFIAIVLLDCRGVGAILVYIDEARLWLESIALFGNRRTAFVSRSAVSRKSIAVPSLSQHDEDTFTSHGSPDSFHPSASINPSDFCFDEILFRYAYTNQCCIILCSIAGPRSAIDSFKAR